ncbi:MAG: hypothetical protein QM803_02615 [Rhodocyclaceae bacterium]
MQHSNTDWVSANTGSGISVEVVDLECGSNIKYGVWIPITYPLSIILPSTHSAVALSEELAMPERTGGFVGVLPHGHYGASFFW